MLFLLVLLIFSFHRKKATKDNFSFKYNDHFVLRDWAAFNLVPGRFSLVMEKRPGPDDEVGPSFKTSTFKPGKVIKMAVKTIWTTKGAFFLPLFRWPVTISTICDVAMLCAAGDVQYKTREFLGLQKGPLLSIFMRVIITTGSCRKAMRNGCCALQNKGITLKNNLDYKKGVCYLSHSNHVVKIATASRSKAMRKRYAQCKIWELP